MLRFLPFILLIVPITEIAVFILVGQFIGLFPTIGLIILTAILGASLLRHQGFGLAVKIRSEMQAGRVPGRELANGAMMLVAGVLLLTPGFVTDTLGFLLFIPQIRTRVFEFLSKRVSFVTPNQGASRGYDNGTIDLNEDEYERENSEAGKNPTGSNSHSPWNTTRH